MAEIFSIYNYKPAEKLMSISGDAESAKYWFQVTLENIGGTIKQATIRIVAKKSETGLDESGYVVLSSLYNGANLGLASGARKTFGEYINISRTMLDRMTAASIRAVPIYIYAEVQYVGNTTPKTQLIEIPECRVLNCYANPAVGGNFSIVRCIDGMENDEGVNVMITARLHADKNTLLNQMKVTLYYAENSNIDFDTNPSIDLSAHIDRLIEGVINDPTIITQTFSNASDWNFRLKFGDEYESIGIAGAKIFKAFANLHLSGNSTGGVCIGGFSTSEEGSPKFECHYPASFYGGIEGVNIYTLDEVKTGGRWIDGKPIYRKCVTGRLTTTNATYIATLGPVGALVKLYGYAQLKNSSGTSWKYAVNTYERSGAEFAVWIEDPNGRIKGFIKTVPSDVYLVVEYTKADDEPVQE